MDQNNSTIDFRKIWEETKKEISAEVSALTYDVWIKALEPVEIRGNSLILSSPSQGARTVVLKNHKEKIERILRDISPFLSGFEIIVGDNTNILERLEEVSNKKEILPSRDSSISKNFSFNPRFTFENYVIGPSNEFTVAAAKAVAENPGTNYNPLFIYGGVGLGKTHLLHAIGNYVSETKPNLNVVYVTIEEFTNEFIETVGKNELNLNTGFRNKYRNADILIVDDIQSIIGKPRVQEEFFHTFNALSGQNKQIIISSDRPPKEITPLEERLRSRFEWGLMTDIGIPEIETRIAILKKKVFIERQLVDDDVLEYIAEAMTTNIREMEGLLSRCVFFAGLMKKPRVTIEVAKDALKNYITDSKSSVDADRIMEQVCKYFGISKNQIIAKDRRKEISYARQICMYLLDEMIGMPYTSIGKLFGKDHSTVIYCKNKVAQDLKSDKNLATQIKDLKIFCMRK